MNQDSSFRQSLSKFRPSARSISQPVNIQNPSPPSYPRTYAKPESWSRPPIAPSSQPVEMSAYKPPEMGQAQPRERSLGTPYRQPAPAGSDRPAVVPIPSYTGDRAADRQAADAYRRSFQGRDLGALSDEEIAAYNEAGRNTGIIHSPWLERAPDGSVLRHSGGHYQSEPQRFAPPSTEPGTPFPMPAPVNPFAMEFGGVESFVPDFSLRDAFIQNINNAMLPYYQGSGTYLGEGPPPDTWGQAPNLDFSQLFNQAQGMVQDGWTNPLAGLFM